MSPGFHLPPVLPRPTRGKNKFLGTQTRGKLADLTRRIILHPLFLGLPCYPPEQAVFFSGDIRLAVSLGPSLGQQNFGLLVDCKG